jgi:hypothetical protein
MAYNLKCPLFLHIPKQFGTVASAKGGRLAANGHAAALHPYDWPSHRAAVLEKSPHLHSHIRSRFLRHGGSRSRCSASLRATRCTGASPAFTPEGVPAMLQATCGSTRGDSGIWREARSHDSKFGLPCCGPESCSQRRYLPRYPL